MTFKVNVAGDGSAGISPELLESLKAQKIDVIENVKLPDGEQTLSTLVDAEKFKDAKAHVFMGKPDLGSLFLFYYLIDAAQSGLPHAFINADIKDESGKSALHPIVLCNYGPNGEKPWNDFIERSKQLREYGLLKEDFTTMVHVVDHPDGILPALNTTKLHKVFTPSQLTGAEDFVPSKPRVEDKPSVFLCCSFSTDNQTYVEFSRQLGKQLAESGYNLVTGGGRYPGSPNKGMMYNSQKAHYDAGGDVTGVTFAKLNPLATHAGEGSRTYGLTRIMDSKHLANRVEIMTDLSDAVLIAPGGFGTDTEGVAPLVMRQALSALMEDKPLIIINMKDPAHPNDPGVHAPLIKLLESVGLEKGKDFHVVEQPELSQNAATDMTHAVINTLKELKVHTHTRKLEVSQKVTASGLTASP